MIAKQLHWTDAHFCDLRSQSNVYGLSKIACENGQIKLLVASLNGELVSVEYHKSQDYKLIPITREEILLSTSSPQGPGGETEIVSMDVVCKDMKLGTLLAISYLKLGAQFEEKSPSAYLNLYSIPDRESKIPYLNIMDAISQSQIQCLSLDFTPFKLMHHSIHRQDGQQETCLLLSGSDKIHVFRQNKDGQFYQLNAVEKYFPEFANINGCVTQMEFRQIDDTHRMTVVGVQSGLVTLSIVNVLTNVVQQTWSTELDSPITSLQLFTQHTNVPVPDFLCRQGKAEDNIRQMNSEVVNLLITSAIDPAVVYCDVINLGLSESHILPHSNTQDIILCTCIMDIDFDGENEILIGTYGQILLAYKLISERPQSMLMTSTPYHSPLPVPVTDSPSRHLVEEKPTPEQADKDKMDNRRRHKSFATALECSGQFERFETHDRHRSDECFQLDGSLKDGQLSRLVKSQENLTTQSPKSVYLNTPEPEMSLELSLPPGTLLDPTDYPCYRLTWTKRFSDPIMALSCDNVMGDGMLTLVVLTLKGLHILQPDMNEVATLVLERLKLYCDPDKDRVDKY